MKAPALAGAFPFRVDNRRIFVYDVGISKTEVSHGRY